MSIAGFVERLVKYFKWIGAAALAAMMALTFIDVVMRAAGQPLLGAVEVIGFLAIITLAGSLPLTHMARGHAAVDMIVRKLPLRIQAVVDSITYVITTVLFAVMSWQMFKYAEALRLSGEISMTIGFPTYILAYIMTGAFVVLSLTGFLDGTRALARTVTR